MTDISQQLQEQVITARREKRKLNIQGGNSKQFMGRNASGDPISIKEHSGIVSYQPVELVLTVRAGTLLKDIEAALDEQGQMLSFEPPRFTDNATIGGTLACNQSGPGRPWTGSVRDHVLGIRLINGRGEHLRFGGQVMKNVAGYDVSRLQAGAMGTLGIITEVSLKVLPKPAHSITLVEYMPAAEAIQLMNQRACTAKPITASCWLDGKLYTRLAGTESAVHATTRQWSGTELEQSNTFWESLRHQQLSFFNDDRPLWRFSINSRASQPNIEGDWLIDWGGSQRWLKAETELSNLELQAMAAGGEVSLFRGGNREGEGEEVLQHQPGPLMALQKKLKQSFDPDAVFNPGRLYSWM